MPNRWPMRRKIFPLIDAMDLDGMPMIMNTIKRELDYLDIYRLQLLPDCYCPADESEHLY